MIFLKNISIYATLSVLEKGMIFLTIPIFSHYLSPDDYGFVANFEITFLIFTNLVLIGGDEALGVEYYKSKFDDFNLYISSAIGNMIRITILIIPFLLLLGFFLADSIGIPYYWFLVVAILAFSCSLYCLGLGYLQAKKNALSYSIVTIVRLFLYLMISLVAISILDYSWESILFAIFFSYTFCGIFFLFFFYRIGAFSLNYFNTDYSKDIFLFGLPLLPHLLSNLVITTTDRLFITNLYGLNSVGIFHIGYTLGSAIWLLVVIFNKAWNPFFFEYLKENTVKARKKIKRVLSLFLGSIFFFSFLLSLLSPFVFDLLINNKYETGAVYVPWIAFSFAIRSISSLLISLLLFLKVTKPILYISLFYIAINFLLDFLLINLYGTIGIVYATFIASLLHVIFTLIIVSRFFSFFTFSFRRYTIVQKRI